jgi:hypothetical protein
MDRPRETAAAATITYWLDPDDRVAATGDEWTRFATANDAPELTPDRVVGRPVTDFFAGEATRRLYAELLARVRRLGRPVRVPFRCDSPDAWRSGTLTFIPDARGWVRVESVTDHRPRPRALRLLHRFARRAAITVTMCSVCKRVADRGDWQALDAAADALGLFTSEAQPDLLYAVCPSCRGSTARAAA